MVRTFPALDAAVRRAVRGSGRGARFARTIGSGERTENEVTNALVLDLIKRRRLDEASAVAGTFLRANPNASRTVFLLGIVYLYQEDFTAARRTIDRAYSMAWTVRDDLSQLPDWHHIITRASDEQPGWVWPSYMRLKSTCRMLATSPEALLALIDTREPPTVVEFSSKFGRPGHASTPPLRKRMRVVVFEGAASSLPLQRVRLNHLTDSEVVHAPSISRAGDKPGSWEPGTVARMLAEAGIGTIDKLHVNAEFASADIVADLLDSGIRPRVVTIDLFRMDLEQRVDAMRRILAANMFMQVTHDQLIAVEQQLVADRRVHAWRVSEADFDTTLVDDYFTEPPIDLSAAVMRALIDNQVRFFISPTDNPRVTRFSLGNPDKGFALSRVMEIDASPLALHVPSLNTVATGTPLIEVHLVGNGRRYLARSVELDFWTDRSDYVRSGNANLFVNWVPSAAVERTMFGFNPPFLGDDPNPPVTLEERLGLTSTVLYHYDFDIDVVFTWVDDADARWRAKRNSHQLGEDAAPRLTLPDSSEARFRNRDELRYALRSVRAFMPQVRHIFLVTDDQVPEWLDPAHPDITVVDHRDIFADPSVLPCFNSNAIETQLKNVPGLSEHFVYFNDDVMLTGPTPTSAFFHANGLTKSFLENQRSQYGDPDEQNHNSKNAVLNASLAFERHFGKSFHQYHRHTPFPLRRSVLEAMSAEFEEELRITASHRFRSFHDVAPISSLYQWYAFHTAASVPAALQTRYLNLGAPSVVEQLDGLRISSRPGVICINDSPNPEVDDDVVHEHLSATLRRLYPVAAPWERPAP